MPELPEVETTRLGLAPRLEGARITGAALGKPLRFALGVPPRDLVGRRIELLTRRGKYLIVELDQGFLLFHLGMSGALLLSCQGEALVPSAHDHFVLQTDRGGLTLRDPRRFGAVIFSADLQQGLAARLLGKVGAEPLDAALRAEHLQRAWAGKSQSIKAALLCGQAVCGAGNIYACEALHRAGIHPARAAGSLSLSDCHALLRGLRATLRRALAAGGASLRNYRQASGQAGHFQLQTRVYGREGEPCGVCGTPIRRIVQGARSSFFCQRCQKLRRVLRRA